jgi:hypothetical protein
MVQFNLPGDGRVFFLSSAFNDRRSASSRLFIETICKISFDKQK